MATRPRRPERLALVLLTALAFLVVAERPAAQELQAVGQIRSAGPVTSEASRKIVSRLRALIDDFRAEGITRGNAAALDAAGRFSSETLRVDATARVHVNVSVQDTSEATLTALRQHGLDIEIVNADFGVVQGWVPVANLEALAGEPVVTKIRPPSYPRPRTGPVNTQGDAIHRCDQVRASGITGAGILVGVLSDGVSGLAASQVTGELGPVSVLKAGSGDEGTAMLEIIHDCAPGAPLAFYGPASDLDFITGVNALRAAGAKVIVDDLGFFSDPYFQDGAIALNDRTVGAAVVRVSSAGNDRSAHHQSNFSPGVFDAQIPGTRHNFGGGDTLLRFHVSGGQNATIVLQWSNQFGAAFDDYDLCVRLTDGSLLTCSVFVQDGNDDPFEFLTVTCPAGPSCAADIQITLFSGSARTLEMFCIPGGACGFDEFNIPGDSIFGHPAVPEVVAVAAAPQSNPNTVELFSSVGPSTILLPAPVIRNKPDVTGVDGVATSRPGFNPFFGTSAAAPHVAAIAALVLAKNPALTATQVRTILTSTAVDLLPAGFDVSSGFGRADAVNAIAATPVPFFAGGVFVAAGNIDGVIGAEIVTGPDAGGGPQVRAFKSNGTPLGPGFFAYPIAFAGGVRVAAADLDGDGRAEIITAAGPGGGPHVRVFKVDVTGTPVAELASFLAYPLGFTGGVFVAAGPVEGPGAMNLVTGAGPGGGPHVRVLRLQSGAPGGVISVAEFFAYPAGFTGGVRVAVGDVNGDGFADIVTGAGPGGGPHVRALTLDPTAPGGVRSLAELLAYPLGFTGGVFVAAGNVSGGPAAELVTGAGPGGGAHVRVFDGTGAPLGGGFFAYPLGFTGGARVAVGDLDAAGLAELVTGAGPGGSPHVRPFDALGNPLGPGFLAY